MSEFIAFPKIPRLSRECVITEKIDGTNASVLIQSRSEQEALGNFDFSKATLIEDELVIYAGSRTRWISPTQDNYGFARWVWDHAQDLKGLGVGHHFGEWWGGKIQRGYGVTEKRFSLFNTARWNQETKPSCCEVVPILFQGPFLTAAAESAIDQLRVRGSFAAPGFMNPEGIVIYHTAGNLMFKKTIDGDEKPKGRVEG